MTNEDYFWIGFIILFICWVGYIVRRERAWRQYLKDHPNTWVSRDD